MSDTQPVVGVVLIGRNEGDRLVRCLQSLQRLRERMIYVDSGSTDGSVESAKSYGADVVELDMSKPFSMARARNVGVARLRERVPDLELIQFVDGDCEVVEDWIDRALAAIKEYPKAAAVCGRRRERYPEQSIYNRLCDLEWNTPIGEARACGGDALMRANVFEEAGGYNEALIAGEEPELCLRLHALGWTIQRIDAEMTRHDANIHHLSQWWKRNVRGGYGGRDIYQRLKTTVTRTDIPFSHMTHSAIEWVLIYPAILLVWAMFCIVWIEGIPGALLLAAALALPFLQALRIARGVRRRANGWRHALEYGLMTMLGKIPQMLGQVKYGFDRRANRTAHLIEYKDHPSGSDWAQDRARYPEKSFRREPSIVAVAIYRFGRWNDSRAPGVGRSLADRLYWLLYRWVELRTGIGINKATAIGPGLRIHHFGGIFVHSDVHMGARCTLRQGVTIGNRAENGPVPIIGDDVEFGAYAQVLGGIHLGNGAKIGAMSVVLQDVPPGATAVGIPARIIRPEHSRREEANDAATR